MTDLTAREGEVLRLAAEGLSNDGIADRLRISRRTVEAHLHTVFRKTGVNRRSQLAGLSAPEPGGTDPADQERIDRYDTLVRRLVDRHLALFEERIEITFAIGAHDTGDRVVERRWTTPKPYVVYRTSRPIVDMSWEDGLDPGQLELGCAVFGQDVQADVLAVTESDRRPLAVVLFQPGLSQPTEWTLSYRSDGLWDPLRATGVDRFGWSTVTSEPRAHRPTVTETVVRMVFPPGWTDVGMVEKAEVGVVSEPVRQRSGQQLVSWRDDSPTAAKYEFGITGRPDE